MFDAAVDAMWVVEAYLTSEGGGPAFNVRFGVEFGGVRYPYRLRIEDPESGNVQRVLRIEAAKPGTLDAQRVYWARYESAQGKTWETRNPGDRSAKLAVRRARWPSITEGRERRWREKAGQHDIEWERQALEELRLIREQTGGRGGEKAHCWGTAGQGVMSLRFRDPSPWEPSGRR